MRFNSNAEEIRYHMKQLLNQGGEYTVAQIKEYVHAQTGKDFTTGTYAGAMRDLVDRDPNYYIPSRGIYAAVTHNVATRSDDVFDTIIRQALSAVEEACKMDITTLTVSEIQQLQSRSSRIKSGLKELLSK